MSIGKNVARLRRAKSTRLHIRKLGVPRLSVLRTGRHLYAQIFTADGSKVIAAANHSYNLRLRVVSRMVKTVWQLSKLVS